MKIFQKKKLTRAKQRAPLFRTFVSATTPKINQTKTKTKNQPNQDSKNQPNL